MATDTKKRRRRRPKTGTVKDLNGHLWRLIGLLSDRIDTLSEQEQPDAAELCRLSHALSQAAGVYLRAVEVAELVARLEALEKAQEK